eukprot:TRINITY_DN435_c0_g1_i2.p1 TRINITY_DN435_c0_g1~~TRINITY_DN435_c0_g1_i2.p1  ORF type:complete len:522 (+),score=124.09 TRINITY_DN435_c0_g1_i2:75-1640(+)
MVCQVQCSVVTVAALLRGISASFVYDGSHTSDVTDQDFATAANMRQSLDDDISHGWSYRGRAGPRYSRFGQRHSHKDRDADGFYSSDLNIARGKGRSLAQSDESEKVAHARERTDAARREFITASKEEIRARKALARRRFEEAVDWKQSRFRQRDRDDHYFSHYHNSGEKDEKNAVFRADANRTSVGGFVQQVEIKRHAETKDSDTLGKAHAFGDTATKSVAVAEVETSSDAVEETESKHDTAEEVETASDAVAEVEAISHTAEETKTERDAAEEVETKADSERETEAESNAVQEVETKSDAVDGTTAELAEGAEIEKRRDTVEENADSASESGEAALVDEEASGNAGESIKAESAESNSEANQGEASESASAAEDVQVSEDSGANAELSAEMAETLAETNSNADKTVEDDKGSSEEKKGSEEESKEWAHSTDAKTDTAREDIDTVLRELHDLNASLDEETTTDMNMDMDMLESTMTTTGLEALVEEDVSTTSTTDMDAMTGLSGLQEESTTQWGTTDGWP